MGYRLGWALEGFTTFLAALVTAGGSYRRFDWATGEDERHVARTADGWDLALYRYRPRGPAKPFPVVMSHGMAGSRLIYDLHPDYSLARYLAARGFDTYLIDLRGRNASWPGGVADPKLGWCFDDFVEHDLPTAVARACELAGAPEAFWVGMEMSGQLLYAAAIRGTASRVRGGVTCGSPVITPSSAQVPGVTAPPRTSRAGRVPFGGGSRLAGPVLAYGRVPVIESSFRAGNFDPIVVARYFRNGVPDESAELVGQFAEWIRSGAMKNRDGSIVYSDRLADVKLPLLVMTAARDLQRPAEATRAAFEAFGSTDKTFVRAGVADGFSFDYGHDDLLAGLASPREIFPRIADWLAAHSAGPRP